MAQNAYSSSISNSNIVSREDEKRLHYRDDPEDDGRQRGKQNRQEDVQKELPFYPAFCFPASPTHFTWVKMSIVDIHRLQSRRGFEGTPPTLHYQVLKSLCLTINRPEYLLSQKPPYPIRLPGRLHPDARRIRAPHRAHGRRQQRLHY